MQGPKESNQRKGPCYLGRLHSTAKNLIKSRCSRIKSPKRLRDSKEPQPAICQLLGLRRLKGWGGGRMKRSWPRWGGWVCDLVRPSLAPCWYTITGFTHDSPAMGGSVAAPVASGRGQGETRRERSLRPLPTVSPAARCYWRGARETRSQVFKERFLPPFGRFDPKGGRDEGVKSSAILYPPKAASLFLILSPSPHPTTWGLQIHPDLLYYGERIEPRRP